MVLVSHVLLQRRGLQATHRALPNVGLPEQRDCCSSGFALFGPVCGPTNTIGCNVVTKGTVTRGLQIQCSGVNFFLLDSRRVLAPAPKVLGSDIKTHLKSGSWLLVHRIFNKGGGDVVICD